MMGKSRIPSSNTVGRIIDKTDSGLYVLDLYSGRFENSGLVRTDLDLNSSYDIGSFVRERHIDIETINLCNNCSNKYFYDSRNEEFYCPMCE